MRFEQIEGFDGEFHGEVHMTLPYGSVPVLRGFVDFRGFDPNAEVCRLDLKTHLAYGRRCYNRYWRGLERTS
eukprot:4609989-Karenia_brevis.AAC.1